MGKPRQIEVLQTSRVFGGHRVPGLPGLLAVRGDPPSKQTRETGLLDDGLLRDHQRHASGVRDDVVEQRKLAVQIRFEPEHGLVGRLQQRGVPALELLADFVDGAGACFAEPLGPQLAESGRGRLPAD